MKGKSTYQAGQILFEWDFTKRAMLIRSEKFYPVDERYQTVDRIALNDANSAYASSYDLVGLRLGYRQHFSDKINAEFFAGADNLFDTKYSLGNDINAAAGRYYNAAPGRNYYGGVSFSFNKK